MNTNKLKIVGCGGHSRVVLDALSLVEHSLSVSLCDSNESLLGSEVAGLIVSATLDCLNTYIGAVHVAIGDNQVRKSIISSLSTDSTLHTIIHPGAIISSRAVIKAGSFIAARAIIAPEATIHEGCIINHGAIVDHEVTIGAYSHIAPNSTLAGRVTVGKGVLIGAGANILPGITIGDGAIIGAGAVVLKNVDAYTTVKGVPAVATE